MREFHFRLWLVLALAWAFCLTGHISLQAAAEPAQSSPAIPSIESLNALKRFRTAPGLKVEVFASEPLIANPVSFAFDEKGRAFVVETHRRRSSVYDIRNHPGWLDADFSFRTVQDRENFFKKVLVPGNETLPARIIHDLNGDGKFDFHDLEVESERIRLLVDTNHDGVADRATTFADGFNSVVSGVAAGVLVHHGTVWFTCIPDLWALRDDDGDGVAEIRNKLLSGFGVHISFGGHDMHGLCLGPDGKLYFSIADRGLNVVTENKQFANPDSGAVMRCNLDGSGFEIIATGLRNPQELAFDQFGNLWTGDNNGDGGDKARWVYVVEGSDSGWHLGWQHLPKLGAWNSEKLWGLPGENTAAYILPPVAHIGHGPAGLAFYPGTGLPPAYDNHFLLCDFPGGVHSFALKPKGAAYEVTDLREFLWELYPVDVAFGPDGGAYVADWIEGWEKTGKGRVYRVFDPALTNSPAIRETRELLAQGFEKKSVAQLARLLGHRDLRIRQAAQFSLADKKLGATNSLWQAARANPTETARYHAIWALGQIGRSDPSALAMVAELSNDASDEVRAQAAKVLGDGAFPPAGDIFLRLIRDVNPRVQFFAAMGLAKLKNTEAQGAILQMLRQNGDRDPYLRHAGVFALASFGDFESLAGLAKDPSDSIRLAAVLALRRLERPETVVFLYDSNTNIVLEAARAINDVPIAGGMSQLASLITKPLPEPILRRSLNANYRLGRLENALAMTDFTLRPDVPETLRADSVQLLGNWATPPHRDWIVGLWRPLAPREARPASLSVRSDLSKLLGPGPGAVRIAAAAAAVKLEIGEAGPFLFEGLTNKNNPDGVRAAYLKSLAALKDSRLARALQFASGDSSESVRKEAALLLPAGQQGPPPSQKFAALLEKGSLREQQAALRGLADLRDKQSEEVLNSWMDQLRTGKVAKELQLDLLEAATRRGTPALKEKYDRYEKSIFKYDPLAGYRDALLGGDAEAGKSIFFEKAEAACLRCHKVRGEGGEVGPELAGVGAKYDREYLLESILFPSKKIAQGFESVIVVLKSGVSYAGLVKKDDDNVLVINSPEDGMISIPKADIQSRDRGLSAMPGEMGNILSKRELRDLVEFLASLK